MSIVLSGLRGDQTINLPNQPFTDGEFSRSMQILNFHLQGSSILFGGWKKTRPICVSQISNVWHRSQLVLVELSRRRALQRPTVTPCPSIRHHQTSPEKRWNRKTVVQIHKSNSQTVKQRNSKTADSHIKHILRNIRLALENSCNFSEVTSQICQILNET